MTNLKLHQGSIPKIIKWCLIGIDYTINTGHKIHFCLDAYDPIKNPGTRTELIYLLEKCNSDEKYRQNTIFWIFKSEVNYWQIYDYRYFSDILAIFEYRNKHIPSHALLKDEITDIIRKQEHIYRSAIIQDRIKSNLSMSD